MAYDPSLTAHKAAEMLPVDAMNASGKTPGEDTALSPMSITGYIDARRKKRPNYDALGPELDVIEASKKVPVNIFNVGPFAHVIPCGSAGTFYIPACPESKTHVKMLTPLYKTQVEIYPKTRAAQAKRLYEDGDKMAIEILGEGRGQNKRNSKRLVGVFIAAGSEPTAKELDDAKAMMTVYASEQILYMDNMWDRDRKLAHDMYRPETFGACARWLGLTGKQKAWLAQGQVSDQIKCPWCEEAVSPNAALCRNCHQVVNQEMYLEMRAKQATLNAAIEPDKKGK